jgi:AraC-like DNA-binding protein
VVTALTRVDLAVNHSYAYYRGVLRGIAHYAETRRTHLDRARRLLAEIDLPLKVLAQQAGFSGLSHQGVVFRQELGLPPVRACSRGRPCRPPRSPPPGCP